MKEVRKLVSDLEVGDKVKHYGVLTECGGPHGGLRLVARVVPSPPPSQLDRWPADAEVTVLVKEKRWRMVATHETADPEIAQRWRELLADSAPDMTGRALATVTFGPVEEVDA